MIHLVLFVLLVVGMSDLSDANVQQAAKLPLAITEAGVGPITESTPADLAQIARLLPQFSVVPGVAYGEGDAFPTIRVMDGKTEILYMFPGRLPGRPGNIVSIVVKSDQVRYAGKVKVGSSFSEVFGGSLPDHCSMGSEEESDDVECYAVPASHVLFVFSGTSDRDDGRMPSLSFLIKWRIKAMRWYR